MAIRNKAEKRKKAKAKVSQRAVQRKKLLSRQTTFTRRKKPKERTQNYRQNISYIETKKKRLA